MKNKKRKGVWVAVMLLAGSASAAVANDAQTSMKFPRLAEACESCEVQLGVGGTYHSWRNTGGLVLPLTVTWSRSRYEFGIFRFAHDQVSDEPESRGRQFAGPYWGASLSRRWKLFEHGPVKTYLGFGVSYKTEVDVLSSTRWNFAEYLAVRVSPESVPAVFEVSVRHWSNGGVKAPNRGQDFAMLTVRFDR